MVCVIMNGTRYMLIALYLYSIYPKLAFTGIYRSHEAGLVHGIARSFEEIAGNHVEMDLFEILTSLTIQ